MKIVEFALSCEENENNNMDTIKSDSQTCHYKIISTLKLYGDYFQSFILLPDFDSKSDTSYIKSLLIKIAIIHPTNEFIAVKDCKTLNIIYQGMIAFPEQKDYLKKNLIGQFIISNN